MCLSLLLKTWLTFRVIESPLFNSQISGNYLLNGRLWVFDELSHQELLNFGWSSSLCHACYLFISSIHLICLWVILLFVVWHVMLLFTGTWAIQIYLAILYLNLDALNICNICNSLSPFSLIILDHVSVFFPVFVYSAFLL